MKRTHYDYFIGRDCKPVVLGWSDKGVAYPTVQYLKVYDRKINALKRLE